MKINPLNATSVSEIPIFQDWSAHQYFGTTSLFRCHLGSAGYLMMSRTSSPTNIFSSIPFLIIFWRPIWFSLHELCKFMLRYVLLCSTEENKLTWGWVNVIYMCSSLQTFSQIVLVWLHFGMNCSLFMCKSVPGRYNYIVLHFYMY